MNIEYVLCSYQIFAIQVTIISIKSDVEINLPLQRGVFASIHILTAIFCFSFKSGSASFDGIQIRYQIKYKKLDPDPYNAKLWAYS